MKHLRKRKLIPFLEAFISPAAGLLLQLALYFLMGVEPKEVSIVFIIIFWVLASAGTAMAFERMELRRE